MTSKSHFQAELHRNFPLSGNHRVGRGRSRDYTVDRYYGDYSLCKRGELAPRVAVEWDQLPLPYTEDMGPLLGYYCKIALWVSSEDLGTSYGKWLTNILSCQMVSAALLSVGGNSTLCFPSCSQLLANETQVHLKILERNTSYFFSTFIFTVCFLPDAFLLMPIRQKTPPLCCTPLLQCPF